MTLRKPNNQLVSVVEGFDLKSKVLGKEGDRRFHGIIIDGVLHFPGFATEH
ncbi:MAG: hypothetical protein SWX82_14745 [Cyanobacteriota bacterium]|nr:hypothetical protein [Cyanobacteriota bacterium]